MTGTPCSTASWKPVPHIDVIEAVTEVVRAHNWKIEGEKFGLAREGQKMFGVMEISSSSSPEWHRCIGIRNSHDKSFAVGLSAGIVVCVCTNMAFGGTTVIKRRHTSGIVLAELIDRAVASLEDDFLTTESVCEELKDSYLRNDDEARSCIVRAAERRGYSYGQDRWNQQRTVRGRVLNVRFNCLLRFTPRLSLFSPEETHDIILCVEFSWMLFKVSLKAFLHARTRASLDFVELNKTVWITAFEVKSPKSP